LKIYFKLYLKNEDVEDVINAVQKKTIFLCASTHWKQRLFLSSLYCITKKRAIKRKSITDTCKCYRYICKL